MPRGTVCVEVDRRFGDIQGAVRAGQWVSACASLATVANAISNRFRSPQGLPRKPFHSSMKVTATRSASCGSDSRQQRRSKT